MTMVLTPFIRIITAESWSIMFDPKFTVSHFQSGPCDEALCEQVEVQVLDEYHVSVLRPHVKPAVSVSLPDRRNGRKASGGPHARWRNQRGCLDLQQRPEG